MDEPIRAGERFQELVGILARLRGPDGCPWDKEQDERSIVNYFLEEVYEAVEALHQGNAPALAEELGDVLMEVVFLARLFEEKGLFTIADALAGINAKMVRRHPHVFGDDRCGDPRRVLDAWVKQKKQEKARESHFEGLSAAAPALLAAFQIGQRAAADGFDWPTAGDALDKVREELRELETAAAGGDGAAVEEEIGDALFALAQVARLSKVNPETALRRAGAKFIGRYTALEARLAERRKSPADATLAEMEAVWDEIKKI